MTTAAPAKPRSELPRGSVRVLPDGLLSRVARACPEHGVESRCVARRDDRGCLVFWCSAAEHHFTAR